MIKTLASIRADHKPIVEWLTAGLAPGRDYTFSAELGLDGALESQTPAGRVTSRLEFVFGDDGGDDLAALGRLVSAEIPTPGWETVARPVFAICIDANGTIRSGDDFEAREWVAGQQA